MKTKCENKNRISCNECETATGAGWGAGKGCGSWRWGGDGGWVRRKSRKGKNVKDMLRILWECNVCVRVCVCVCVSDEMRISIGLASLHSGAEQSKQHKPWDSKQNSDKDVIQTVTGSSHFDQNMQMCALKQHSSFSTSPLTKRDQVNWFFF